MSTVMYPSAYATGAPIVTPRFACAESLMQLLADAKAAIESDVTAARACIEQAAELLRPGLSDDRIRSVRAPIPRGGLAPWQAKRIASYIEANLASSIRIEELAKIVQLSTSHFFRVFKQSFGIPALTYIAHQRVRKAQQLMMGLPESSGADRTRLRNVRSGALHEGLPTRRGKQSTCVAPAVHGRCALAYEAVKVGALT